MENCTKNPDPLYSQSTRNLSPWGTHPREDHTEAHKSPTGNPHKKESNKIRTDQRMIDS